jgi:hypothetical protein
MDWVVKESYHYFAGLDHVDLDLDLSATKLSIEQFSRNTSKFPLG